MPTRPSRSQAGSAAVEFALVLPLVLVVALALVQVGLLVRDRLLIEAAARAGARSLYALQGCPQLPPSA
jgi:Flp pilus assembly protein TadG